MEDFKLLFNNTAAGESAGSSEVSAADAAAPFSILDTLGASLPAGINSTDGDPGGGAGGAKDWTGRGVRGLIVNGISPDQAAVLQQRSAVVQAIFADAATEIPGEL
jgi:hypothetical protein